MMFNFCSIKKKWGITKAIFTYLNIKINRLVCVKDEITTTKQYWQFLYLTFNSWYKNFSMKYYNLKERRN